MSSNKQNDKEGTYIMIYIHDPKQMSKTKDNILSKSSGILRVRGFLKKEKKWTTLSYMIPIKNLGLEENADKKEIYDKLLNPYSIINKDTKGLLQKLLDQYGPIKGKGRNRLEYKTERFKKKWKMKTRRVGGV
ncbi:MAG: hypothetical protein ACFFD2_01305 [Promethearchaeota archaeon]